jgi:hypothetical protein
MNMAYDLKSPVKMDRGSQKKSIFEDLSKYGPHENRFIPANLNPKILAKYVNYDGPDFRRYTKRDFSEDSNSQPRKKPVYEKKPMPDYYPDKEKCLKSLRLGMTEF